MALNIAGGLIRDPIFKDLAENLRFNRRPDIVNAHLGRVAHTPLGVQPMASWRELWVFRQTRTGWSIDVLPPGTDEPDLGYVESAGWVPASRQLLIVREVRTGDGFRRRFEFMNLDTLLVQRWASTPDLLRNFARWQDPLWRSTTVALR